MVERMFLNEATSSVAEDPVLLELVAFAPKRPFVEEIGL
jgi:hypothetical protein